jgi:hypothetical protein
LTFAHASSADQAKAKAFEIVAIGTVVLEKLLHQEVHDARAKVMPPI